MRTSRMLLIGVIVAAIVSAGVGWSVCAKRADERNRAELAQVYAAYNRPECLSAGELDRHVGYIVDAEKMVRRTDMSDAGARAKIARFVQAGVPKEWWVRFALYPAEFAAWHGPKTQPCSRNPNA